MPYAPKIIVVGVGRVGLLNALGLARAGAAVTVIDADPVLNDSPRAMTHTDPTMQLMQRLGILDAAEKIGIQHRHINFVWPNDDLVITIATVKAEPNRVHPHNLQFGQEALGAIAIWGWSLKASLGPNGLWRPMPITTLLSMAGRMSI